MSTKCVCVCVCVCRVWGDGNERLVDVRVCV